MDQRRFITSRRLTATWALGLGLSVGLGGPSRPFGFPDARLMAQASARTVWDGVYTTDQAARGEQEYKRSCGYCHKDDLSGGFFDDGTGRAPALAGPRAFDSSFEERWVDYTIRQLLIEVGSAMPQQAPGSLTIQAYADIVAFLLASNDVPSGTSELPADLDELATIGIPPKPTP